VTHRIPDLFKDPDRFDPDRYASGREEDKRPFAFQAFGGGSHKCLGNAFALLQIKTIFALLMRRFAFSSYGDPLLPDFHGVVIGPKQPCRVRYRRLGRDEVNRFDASPSASAREKGDGNKVTLATGGAKCPFTGTSPEGEGRGLA
jgi:sterol 14-demethylase